MEFQYIKLPLVISSRATENELATVEDSNGNLVIDINGFSHLYPEGDATKSAEEENLLANVFAAAPELLEALEGILDCVNVRIDDPRIQKFDTARAAIAKAYGKTKD